MSKPINATAIILLVSLLIIQPDTVLELNIILGLASVIYLLIFDDIKEGENDL